MFKKGLLAAFLALNLLIPTGCWNRREPENYAWVTWVALDKGPGDTVKLTVALTRPLSPIPTGAALPEKLSYSTSATGDTPFEAVRNMISHVPKRLFWGHLRAVIISEEIARTGIEEYLDLLLRDQEIRRTPWVFVTRVSTEQIFKINSELEKNPAILIDGLAKAESGATGKSRIIRLSQLHGELADSNFDPVVGVLGIWDRENEIILSPKQNPSGKCELALNGSAVFQGDKLVGWLSPKESQIYVLMRGELKGSLMVVPDPENPKNTIGLEILDTKQKLTVELDHGQVKVNLKLTLKANLGDQRLAEQKFITPKSGAEFYASLSKALEQKVQSEAMTLLDKFDNEFQADCLGVGDHLFYSYPKDWKNIKTAWHENLSNIEYSIAVNVNVAAPSTMRTHYPKDESKTQE